MATPINIPKEGISADDWVAAQIIASLKYYMPLVMKKANGYFFDLREVNGTYESIEQMRDFPIIDISMVDSNFSGPASSLQHRHKVGIMTLKFDCFLFLSGNIALGQNRFARDVLKFLFDPAYRYVPRIENAGLHWAREINPTRVVPFGIKATSPNCGVEVYADIHYAFSTANVSIPG